MSPQIANFLLESTIERLHYKLEYADRDIGKLLLSSLACEIANIQVSY